MMMIMVMRMRMMRMRMRMRMMMMMMMMVMMMLMMMMIMMMMVTLVMLVIVMMGRRMRNVRVRKVRIRMMTKPPLLLVTSSLRGRSQCHASEGSFLYLDQPCSVYGASMQTVAHYPHEYFQDHGTCSPLRAQAERTGKQWF